VQGGSLLAAQVAWQCYSNQTLCALFVALLLLLLVAGR
jgi:hypothetical protein